MLGAIDGVSDMSRGTYTVRKHDGLNYIFIMDKLYSLPFLIREKNT